MNWTVNVPTSTPIIIDGTYQCTDSSPSTWSTNTTAGGLGFCAVFAVPAVRS